MIFILPLLFINLRPTAILVLYINFLTPFLAISTDKTQFAELCASTLQQSSANNRIKLCRKGFSTTTDETLLCLTSLFYIYGFPSVSNCKVESILLADDPQVFYLADGMYHVVSRHLALRMKYDSRSAGFTITTLTCQAFIVRPSCSSAFSFNQGDLVLTPDMNFCETHPLTVIASIQLTPSLDQVFKRVPPASIQFHVYSVAEARQSVLNSIRMELAEITDVEHMSPEALDQRTKAIAAYYSSIPPATSAALTAFLTTRTAVCFSLLSITVSLFTFCVSFTLFRRQWRRLFSHPQKFFRGTSGRILHIVDNSSPPTADDFFCIFPLPSSMPCKSLLKKLYVDLHSLLILLLILPLTLPLTLSLPLTRLPLTLTVFTP